MHKNTYTSFAKKQDSKAQETYLKYWNDMYIYACIKRNDDNDDDDDDKRKVVPEYKP
jgi:hypothetical protein